MSIEKRHVQHINVDKSINSCGYSTSTAAVFTIFHEILDLPTLLIEGLDFFLSIAAVICFIKFLWCSATTYQIVGAINIKAYKHVKIWPLNNTAGLLLAAIIAATGIYFLSLIKLTSPAFMCATALGISFLSLTFIMLSLILKNR